MDLWIKFCLLLSDRMYAHLFRSVLIHNEVYLEMFFVK